MFKKKKQTDSSLATWTQVMVVKLPVDFLRLIFLPYEPVHRISTLLLDSISNILSTVFGL